MEKWRVIQWTKEFETSRYRKVTSTKRTAWQRFAPYGYALIFVFLLTIMLWTIGPAFTLVNSALLYLLPVLLLAVRFGFGPAAFAAGIGVISFDFFFVPPIFQYTVSDARYLVSFAIFLIVAFLTASLAAKLRQRVTEANEKEEIASALYDLSTQVAATSDLNRVLDSIIRHAKITFGYEAVICLPDQQNLFHVYPRNETIDSPVNPIDPNLVTWVFEHGQTLGLGTKEKKDHDYLYMPIRTDSNVYGVFCLVGGNATQDAEATKRKMSIISALSGLAAVTIARVQLEEEAKTAHLLAESEKLRTALLDSISHELRTPLSTIIGAVGSLIDHNALFSPKEQSELLSTIREGAMRMNRLVSNLLGMVRLESGMLRLHRHATDLSDVIGVALRQVEDSIGQRQIDVLLPAYLPLIAIDDVLIEQVLVNVISNALKYSDDASPIMIQVIVLESELMLHVRDYGIGIAIDECERIFEKFYRGKKTSRIPGTGLGLAICKGILQAHGGSISARPAPDQGTIFSITLPITDDRVENVVERRGI